MTTTRRRLAFAVAVLSADLAVGGILARIGADTLSWGIWGASIAIALAGVAVVTVRRAH